MNPAVWGNYAQWAGAAATSLAVFVALLKEEFLRCIRRPKLTVRIRPEDSNLSPIAVTRAGHPRWLGEAYFLRMWIENTGNQRAEKVQVFLNKVLREQLDGSFRPLATFFR